MIPAKLKSMTLRTNGNDYRGEVTEVTVPKITRKTEEYRAGGMQAPIDIDLGMEKLELEVKFGGFMQHVFLGIGTARADDDLHRYIGAYQSDDTGLYTRVEIQCRGRYSEVEMGTAKVGDDSETMMKATLTYYRLLVNGVETLEIDILNHIFRVGGVDRLAQERLILGL